MADALKDDIEGKHDDAHGDHGAPPKGGKPGAKPPKKGADHKEAIIVVLTTIGVLIAWLTYKSSKSNSSSGTDTTALTSGVGNSTGTVANDGVSAGSDATDGFASYLENLSGEITQLQSNVGDLGTQVGAVQTQISALPPATTVSTGTTTTKTTTPTKPTTTPVKAPAAPAKTGTVYTTPRLTSFGAVLQGVFGKNYTASQVSDFEAANKLGNISAGTAISGNRSFVVYQKDASQVVKQPAPTPVKK